MQTGCGWGQPSPSLSLFPRSGNRLRARASDLVLSAASPLSARSDASAFKTYLLLSLSPSIRLFVRVNCSFLSLVPRSSPFLSRPPRLCCVISISPFLRAIRTTYANDVSSSSAWLRMHADARCDFAPDATSARVTYDLLSAIFVRHARSRRIRQDCYSRGLHPRIALQALSRCARANIRFITSNSRSFQRDLECSLEVNMR